MLSNHLKWSQKTDSEQKSPALKISRDQYNRYQAINILEFVWLISVSVLMDHNRLKRLRLISDTKDHWLTTFRLKINH